jgi:uncharacterized protein YjiS (DUF1127 family)
MFVRVLQGSALAGRSPRNAALPEMRTSALSACVGIVETWITRSDQRRALRELAEEGRMLNDVGLTRQQTLSEAGKPFWRR